MSREMDSISVRAVRQQDAAPLAELWIAFGIGRALIDAVAWGRERGASEVVVISYAFSPTSVPFHEEDIGYDRKTIGFRKSLG
jgi:hypothetical protein